MFSRIIWQRLVLVREVRHGPNHMPPYWLGRVIPPDVHRKGTQCISSDLLYHPLLSAAISSMT